MFHVDQDGSAVVSNVPITPFIPSQHQQVNVTTVNLLANYSLRVARERGWLQTEEDLKRATHVYASNDARPLLEQEGYAHKGDDLTFFYAGVEASLAARQPHFHYPPVPSTLLLWCRFFVSHVGSSSYAIYGELHSYLEGNVDSTKRPLGHFKVVIVQVSKALRTTRPIPPARKDALTASYERTRAYLAANAADNSVTRLSARALLAASGLVAAADPATVDVNHLVLCPHEGSRCSDGKTRLTRFHKLCVLRESDMDFNLHLNQVAMQLLVLNTFRAALRDDGEGAGGLESIYPRLLNGDVQPLFGDLLLRSLRIDYVREIPMTHEATEVFLFPLNDASMEKMLRSSPGARLNEVAEIGFFSCGIRNATATDDRFLATVGVFHCYV